MIEKLQEHLNATIEVFDNMPLTNAKNKKEYITRVSTLKDNLSVLKDQAQAEINKRVSNINSILENPKIKSFDEQINILKNKVYLLNKVNTPYTKLNLDKLIYDLGHYYKDDLVKINEIIVLIIKKFKEAGIELSSIDFNYSFYTYNYMKHFFNEGNVLDEVTLKNNFEQSYWKCPNIIKHIELNFKYLYRKNIKRFEKYISKINEEYLKQNNLQVSDIINKLNETIVVKDDLKSIDAKVLLDLFVDKKLDIKVFDQNKIQQIYETFINKKYTSLEEYRKYDKDLKRYFHSLVEYSRYLDFDFIITDIKKIYSEKDKYKNISKNDLKSITKEETKLFKLNKKLVKLTSEKKGLFSGKKDDNKIEEIDLMANNKINEIAELYNTYEKNSFCENMSKEIIDSSSILDCLCFAFGNYDYLIGLINTSFEGISKEEAEQKIVELDNLIISPYNTVINNISINEDVNSIPHIIGNHYKLLNFKVDETIMTKEQLISLSDQINNIFSFFNIEKSAIKLSDISFILDVKNKIK